MPNYLGENLEDILERHRKEKIPIEDVSFYASKTDLDKQNFLNGGERTYVMSTLDNADKFSLGFRNCISLVVMGIGKDKNKNISLLSHQYPKRDIAGKFGLFTEHLEERLNEVKNRCEPGTIDAIILGGNYTPDGFWFKSPYMKDYLEALQLLSKEVKKLGFDPKVINGPKRAGTSDAIYVDTKERRVYFSRLDINHDAPDFPASDVSLQEGKWNKFQF